jgi:hypothetical protein
MMQCKLHGMMLRSGKLRIGSAMIPYMSFPCMFLSLIHL